jgi:hypothetical protein
VEQFVVAAIFLFGLIMAFWAVVEWRHARMSVKWPTVEGQVVRSVISVPAERTWRRRWYWHVEYRYRVDAHTYRGWRTYFGSTLPISVARNIVRKFPAQSAVTVYYHPRKHGRSVLLPGVNKYTRIGFAIAPVCWAMAAVFWMGFERLR